MKKNNENEKKRLVVDAQCWVSYLLKPSFLSRMEIVFGSEYCLLCSGMLFRELDKAIRKPYLAKRIIRTDYEELIFKLRSVAEHIDVHSVVEICRDPKDNYLLALAKDGNADYLITGDTDLHILKEFESTKIVDLSEFENIFCHG
jgi:putative PIN family toxin of toxin-antitoxin system